MPLIAPDCVPAAGHLQHDASRHLLLIAPDCLPSRSWASTARCVSSIGSAFACSSPSRGCPRPCGILCMQPSTGAVLGRSRRRRHERVRRTMQLPIVGSARRHRLKRGHRRRQCRHESAQPRQLPILGNLFHESAQPRLSRRYSSLTPLAYGADERRGEHSRMLAVGLHAADCLCVPPHASSHHGASLPHACSGIGCRGLSLRATEGDSR